MITFKGEPNLLVRFNPPIGNIKHVRFDEKGEFTTGNERLIKRFSHKFDSVPVKEDKNEQSTSSNTTKPPKKRVGGKRQPRQRTSNSNKSSGNK